MNYKKAGVDIAAGDQLVEWLKQTQPQSQPHQDRLVEGIGGFASLFRADFPEMKEPCLVTSTDGVGTKLKVAVHFEDYRGIGQDLVAMSVNDLICCGAEPLLFLDYYATGRLELAAAQEFLAGVRRACQDSGCLLIGGETAEMPGVYQGKDFDCAGFAVGVVDRPQSLGAHRVRAGDALVAVASQGFHSNGFSLLRQVFAADLENWRDELLRPTALYPKLVKALTDQERVEAVAHITGGGLKNISRVVPAHLQPCLRRWTWPEPFQEVQRRTQMSETEMLETLNCGLGLVVICRRERTQDVLETVQTLGFEGFELGAVRPREEGQGEEYQFDDKL